MSKKKQKDEAIKRLKKMDLKSVILESFQDNGKLLCSNYGEIKEVPVNILKQIRRWEEQFGGLAFHVIYSELYGFKIYSALSVSKYPEDWLYENAALDDKWPIAYTINLTEPDFSESGQINIMNNDGILLRMV